MVRILLGVDLQNDFYIGSLRNIEAQEKIFNMCNLIKEFDGDIYLTMDTHDQFSYLISQEGRNLPVLHCIRDTHGWRLIERIADSLPYSKNIYKIEKSRFGAPKLIDMIRDIERLEEIHVFGLVTDICLITNVLMIKAFFPEIKIIVHADCCAGTTPEKHLMALEVMRSCQVEVV